MDLTKLSDEELSKLREDLDAETWRRYTISHSADQIIEAIRTYADAGGDVETLAGEVADGLASDA